MHPRAAPVPKTLACAALALACALAALPDRAGAQAASPATAAACPALLQHSFNRLQDEKPQPLCQYAGKVLLVVNTASYCGFAPQFTGLEALHAKYAARGLVVLGFPSNDFGQQEAANAKQTADVCFNTYGVKFPMFMTTPVAGKAANPVFASLAQATGKAPAWNFHKYVVDRQGKALGSFASGVTPSDPALVAMIEKALAQP